MKHIILLLAVLISTDTFVPQAYWAIFGPLEVSTETTGGFIGISTGPVSNVILHSPTTPDCYRIVVTPNGTLKTEWVVCPR